MPIPNYFNVFWHKPVCTGEEITFKTEKHQQLWQKLHYKKCSRCRNAIHVVLGNSEQTKYDKPTLTTGDFVRNCVLTEISSVHTMLTNKN